MDITSDITSMTNFKREHKDICQHLRDTGRSVVLTIKGKAAVVVVDAQVWQQTQDHVERLEKLLGLRRSLDQALAGETSDARTFFDAIDDAPK